MFARMLTGLIAFISMMSFVYADPPIAVVKLDGSSTVYPVSEAVAEDFQALKKNAVRVTVGISGTGGGFKKFCRGDIDIANASRPILASEIKLCNDAGISFIELPVAFDALTVVVNPKNTFVQQLTVAELKTIWEPAAQGKIKTWKQVNASWPDTPIKLYGPGSDSGTFDYFTESINGRAKAMRTDYTASEDDNVLVQGVSRDVGAIGFFGYSYYIENKNKVKAIPIVNSEGKPILPNEKSVESGSYQPLSRPIFIYVNANAINKSEVKDFVEYYIKEAPRLVRDVKYIPLPSELYKAVLARVSERKQGSVFGGHIDTKLTIKELFQKESVR